MENKNIFENSKIDEPHKFKIRTDLAVELKEDNCTEVPKYSGVKISEDFYDKGKIKVTKVIVKNKQGEELLGKPAGKYITLEAKELAHMDEDYHRIVSVYFAKFLKEVLPENCKRILIVGLGNRDATPDSLGPKVVDNIFITRKMTELFKSAEILDEFHDIEISAVSPGVMAQTGMESAEIIRGLVREICPDVVLAIDSLAARSVSRLNTTIQISDSGINPGSGVGNHRQGITEKSVGAKVIAIGIPTVVDAATIVNDTMENLIEICAMSDKLKPLANSLKTFTPEEKYQLIKEIISPDISGMYVTPKDVDETIKSISFTISEGINLLFSGNN